MLSLTQQLNLQTKKPQIFSFLFGSLVNFESRSHPALISTPPTTWGGEVCTQQVRTALVWLKLRITTSETLSLWLAAGLLGSRRPPRRHSTRTACPMAWRQLSLMTQVAVTGDPRATTELRVWMWAHGRLTSSEREKINSFISCYYKKEHQQRKSRCRNRFHCNLRFRYFHLD